MSIPTRPMQSALHLPLLLELAARGAELIVQRGWSDLNDAMENLAKACPLPDEYNSRTTKNGQWKFRNDVEYAKKQLLSDGLVGHVPRERWWITREGLGKLTRWLESHLASLSSAERRKFACEQDENEREFYFVFLQHLNEDQQISAISVSHNTEELLMESIRRVDPACIEGLMSSAYELFVEWMKPTWIDACLRSGYKFPRP